MKNIFKIALRNLLRYKRRTLLTSLLIILGVVMVVVFSGISKSFKEMMIGTITDSMIGHLQIHKRGYVSSVDNLPLHLNLNETEINTLKSILDAQKDVIEAYTFRIKFGAMLSNYEQTTNIRLTAVIPEMENKASPTLVDRIMDFSSEPHAFVNTGELIVPENLAKGLKLKIGQEVVLVATNRDGSVNGMSFTIAGIMSGLTGPSGRDGYMHLNDAKDLLRIDGNEINEIAIRIKDSDNLKSVNTMLSQNLRSLNVENDKSMYELHTWAQLSPFSTIATIVDLLIYIVKIVLISIVLISILNVMIMSVFERVSEIGTISAIGTLPSNILWLFVTEGFLLGFISAIVGSIISVFALYLINIAEIHFSFGRMQDILLQTSISIGELITVSIIVIIISILSSFQPAYKASKMEPVDALRHV
jgi:putative ABC transport system permease protein